MKQRFVKLLRSTSPSGQRRRPSLVKFSGTAHADYLPSVKRQMSSQFESSFDESYSTVTFIQWLIDVTRLDQFDSAVRLVTAL